MKRSASITVLLSCFMLIAASSAGDDIRTGTASWYRDFRLANGRIYVNGYYAAMWGVPFGTKVRVTDLDTGKSIEVTINDRGPNKRLVEQGRIIDLTEKAFHDLSGDIKKSVLKVKVEILKTGKVGRGKR